MDPFADFGIEPKDLITGYISGVISALIVPVQLIVLKVRKTEIDSSLPGPVHT